MADPVIMLITDRRLRPLEDLWRFLPDAAAAGLTSIMIREKDLPGLPLLAIARHAVATCRALGVDVIVNDRIDVALASEADGVHLGVAAIPLAAARKMTGERLRIGCSTHSIAELIAAEKEGADYATFGPVFETASKAAFGPPVGISALREATLSVPLPVLALGGVTPERSKKLAGTGIAGVAAISSILLADNPPKAIHEMAVALTACRVG